MTSIVNFHTYSKMRRRNGITVLSELQSDSTGTGRNRSISRRLSLGASCVWYCRPFSSLKVARTATDAGSGASGLKAKSTAAENGYGRALASSDADSPSTDELACGGGRASSGTRKTDMGASVAHSASCSDSASSESGTPARAAASVRRAGGR